MFVYFWERQESKQERDRETEREGDTESEVGSRLWAVSTEPDSGLELMNCKLMTRAEARRLTDWATQAPRVFVLFGGPKPLGEDIQKQSFTLDFKC